MSQNISRDGLQGVPQEVVNELAILEDRAIRAAQRSDNLQEQVVECRAEIASLRSVVDELTDLAQDIATWARALSEEAEEQKRGAEAALQHALVLRAG